MEKRKVKLVAGNIVLGLMVWVVLASGLAYAQTAPAPSAVKTIFDYKQELNLTDRQEQDIKAILQELNKEVRVTRAKLTLIDVEATDLIKNEGDLEQIRKKLKDAAEIQVSLKMADIMATRKINGTMSREQLKKWRELQAAAGKPQK